MELNGKRVVVVGLGRSGVSVCRFCRGRGAEVLGVDDLPADRFSTEVAEELRSLDVALQLGGQPRDAFCRADLIVVSPGVPGSDAIEAAESGGVKVVAEVELASWYLEGDVVGITGTNGKSTVTALIGEMLSRSGVPTFVGGNFGTPLIEAVGSGIDGVGSRLVVELSSFQLERIERLRPRVAVLLNVTEDHLDRYSSMADYVAAKGRIFIAQRPDDAAVVNGDDALCLSVAKAGRAVVHQFGKSRGEVFEVDDELVDEGQGRRYSLATFTLAGAHNRSNACAAVLAARLAGASPEAIAEALAEFRGLPHRMERVAEGPGGVIFYNDSKATNVGATVAALEGLNRPVVLIAGGRDKGGDYGPLRDEVVRRARAVVLIGEAADRIAEALRDVAVVERARDMDEAVARAAALAHRNDAVLLAPACSSFDMYRNYVERGEVFAKAVANFLPRMSNMVHLKERGGEEEGSGE